MRPHSILLAATLALACAAPGLAQSNTISGLDVRLGQLGGMQNFGRQGAFPNGVSGLSMATTSCNVGTVNVPWEQAMKENHPFIAFLIAREDGGRFEQVSDASFVKHAFFALSSSQCTPCQNPSNGTFLGVGCSDTYSTTNNGEMYWLGPPEEIDPWLGAWSKTCSHFDRGEPAVPAPQDCDGLRSLTTSQVSALGPVGHRIHVLDADFNRPGATFWYQAQYVVRGEAESKRDDNLGSRRLSPTWSGSAWVPGTSGSLLHGSVLQRWSGASVSSATNGLDDGRLYVGVLATDNGDGTWHYEYAVHNRDNLRGVGAFRLPVGLANVFNLGFRDVDQKAGNDWSAQVVAGELVFSTGNNPLRWNQIFNFWFDSDAPPQTGVPLALDQFLAGAGQPTVTVLTTAPFDPCPPAAVYCTAKASSLGCTPSIAAAGTPSASLAAPFVISAADVVSQQMGVLFYGSAAATIPFQGGTLCVQAPIVRTAVQGSGGGGPPSDCSGTYGLDFNAVIQGGAPGLAVGAQVFAQYWFRDPGDSFGTGLTDAVSFTVCP